MDILGHLLLGAAVAGKVTPYTVAMSLLPDIGALPLQVNKAWRNPAPWMVTFYRLWHSPLMLLVAYFLPAPGFMLVATHVVSDMVTHKRPYSDFPVFQWAYTRKAYWFIVITLGGIACVRSFF